MKKTIKPASCSSASILNNSRVLVIGGDHENTLASVRALGLAGIDFDLLIHSGKSCGKSSVFASKYAPVPIYAEGSYDSIHKAIKAWLGDSNPADCLLMPSSDLSALVIDERFRSLGVKTSGFLGDEWQICDLMDKHAQSQWAAARGIPVAKGVEIDLAASGPHSPLALPVIIKPAVSAEGQKSDIRICRNPAEYADAVSAFSNAGYKRVLVQELIGYEYEVTCVGLIRLDGSLAWRAYAKEVVYPEGRGSIASGRLETDPSVLQVIHRVLSTLAEEGYRGLCDIEFFKTPDRVLLNEINFRQSGIVAFTFYEGLYLPSIWAKECLGLPNEFVCEYPKKSYRVIYETSYFRYMRDTGTSAFEWIKALSEAGGKNLIFTGDNGPLRVFIWNTVTNKFRRLAGIKV